MTDTHDTKVCSKCGEEKNLTDFWEQKSAKDGRKSWCASCCRQHQKSKPRTQKHIDYCKQYRKNNKDKIALYKEKNKERIALVSLQYRKNNKEKLRIKNRIYKNKRKQESVIHRLAHSIQTRIGQTFKAKKFRKSSSTKEILGCDIEFFKLHIEKQFYGSMSWENRSEWAIDHIIPISCAITIDDVIRLNHFTNLRPIWRTENQVKYNKVEFLL
jgi:hypothetical protein